MKTAFPALLFFASISALCQAPPQRPIDPGQLFRMPFQQSPRDFNKLPSFKARLNVMPLPRVVIPAHTPRLSDPHLDAQIIHRPPQNSFAKQQPRTPLAGNLYPGLQLLPIETARLEPNPIDWPKFTLESIPIQWPDEKVTPIQSNGLSAVPKK